MAEDKDSAHGVSPSGLEYAASWAASAALTEVVRAGEIDSLCRAILRHTADAAQPAPPHPTYQPGIPILERVSESV